MSAIFSSKNPMTQEILWEGKSAGITEIDNAIEQARQAGKGWASLTEEERFEHLLKFQEALTKSQDSLALAISQETGKPLWESKEEVLAMAAKVDISKQAQDQRCRKVTSETKEATSVVRYKPLGVAAVFGPFNFPGHLPNGHIVPALLAGNTVVFKPSEHTPYVAEKMVKVWQDSGLPAGVLNLVQGGPETGKILSSHKGIDALYFTGSWKTGRLLAKIFGEHPEKLLALEMGGNNPIVVGNISDIATAAAVIARSAFLTTGQRCTCCRRLIIPDSKFGEELLEAVVEAAAALTVGAFRDQPEPFMGPVIDRHASNSLLTAQQALLSFGGKSFLVMKEKEPGTPLITPAIIDVTPVKKRSDEELFGPLLQVIRVKDYPAAICEANNTRFGLTASLLSDDRSEFDAFYQEIKAGVINWNMPTTGASSRAPFGGVGQSGNFRPSALYAADYCNYPVASLIKERCR